MKRHLLWIVVTMFAATFVADSADAFYHTGLGRFANRDPIAYRGGDANLYQYVRGNPPIGLDPIGLTTVVIIPSENITPIPMRGPDSQEDVLVEGGHQDYVEHHQLENFPRQCEANGWPLLCVDDISDANEQLVSTVKKCGCITELKIFGHGSDGQIHIGPLRDGVNDVLEGDRGFWSWDDAYGLELFEGVKFCKDKPCTIYLLGCHTGRGPNGQTLINFVRTRTGCTVVAPREQCSRGVNDNRIRRGDNVARPPVHSELEGLDTVAWP